MNGLNINNKYLNALSLKSVMPHIIEERNLNITSMDVFSRLMMDRIIFLGTEIDDYVANVINAQLLFLEQQDEKKPIHLYINSHGGSCYAGLSIYDLMNYVKCPVYTYVVGVAASMAFVLAVSGEKKHRHTLLHSRFMQHQPMGNTWGQASDIAIYHREIQNVQDDLYQIISANTGQDIEKVRHDCDRDYWMRGEQAKEYGAVDKILIKRK